VREEEAMNALEELVDAVVVSEIVVVRLVLKGSAVDLLVE